MCSCAEPIAESEACHTGTKATLGGRSESSEVGGLPLHNVGALRNVVLDDVPTHRSQRRARGEVEPQILPDGTQKLNLDS